MNAQTTDDHGRQIGSASSGKEKSHKTDADFSNTITLIQLQMPPNPKDSTTNNHISVTEDAHILGLSEHQAKMLLIQKNLTIHNLIIKSLEKERANEEQIAQKKLTILQLRIELEKKDKELGTSNAQCAWLHQALKRASEEANRQHTTALLVNQRSEEVLRRYRLLENWAGDAVRTEHKLRNGITARDALIQRLREIKRNQRLELSLAKKENQEKSEKIQTLDRMYGQLEKGTIHNESTIQKMEQDLRNRDSAIKRLSDSRQPPGVVQRPAKPSVKADYPKDKAISESLSDQHPKSNDRGHLAQSEAKLIQDPPESAITPEGMGSLKGIGGAGSYVDIRQCLEKNNRESKKTKQSIKSHDKDSKEESDARGNGTGAHFAMLRNQTAKISHLDQAEEAGEFAKSKDDASKKMNDSNGSDAAVNCTAEPLGHATETASTTLGKEDNSGLQDSFNVPQNASKVGESPINPGTRALTATQRKRQLRKIKKAEDAFAKEEEDVRNRADAEDKQADREQSPSLGPDHNPSTSNQLPLAAAALPLKTKKQLIKEQAADFNQELDRLRNPPTPQNRHELLDHCINLFTYFWKVFPEFEGTDNWNHFKNKVEQAIRLARNTARSLDSITDGDTDSKLAQFAPIVLRDPKFIKSQVFHKALVYTEKLALSPGGLNRLFLSLSPFDFAHYLAIVKEYTESISTTNQSSLFADDFITAQKLTCSPRVFFLVCRHVGSITRDLEEYRNSKHWSVIETPREERLGRIFNTFKELCPVYKPRSEDEYFFEDLYSDAPDWQRELIDWIIHEDASDCSSADEGISQPSSQSSLQ